LQTSGGFCLNRAGVVKEYEYMALDKTETSGAEDRETAMPDDVLSDNQLIEAARGGDDGAFAEIVARYRNPITNYLYRFLNDYEEAVDLAQETFVRVYFAMGRYHTGYAFSTYIYRIATNLAISEIRKRKRRNVLSLTGLFQKDETDTTEYQPPDIRPTPDANLLDDEKSRLIEKAIVSLPPKYRAAIVLRDVEGLSYDEIAEIMGLGLGTTKSRINRARGLLKEKLKGYF
jgi:RNA polymerase sigma-70 factor (ECF subfamily)